MPNGKDLRGADLADQPLAGAKLCEVRFDRTNFLNANLEEAVLTKTTLGGACFNKANLKKADLSEAYLQDAKFVAANIEGTKFNYSQLGGGSVSPFVGGSTRANVVFSNAKFTRATSFLGVDIGNNNWADNPLLKRHIEDQQWLYAWRNKRRLNKHCLYWIWWASCDCGRSFILWAFWSMVFAIGFGFLFRDDAGRIQLPSVTRGCATLRG